MNIYRLSREKYARDRSGTGAMLHGGRWNSRGKQAIYTAENVSLAKLEVTVHLALDLIPLDYCLIEIALSDAASIEVLDISKLSSDWNTIPHSESTQLLGDAFLDKNQYLALKVPSAIVPQEHNYILNPNHPEFARVKITKVEAFRFDNRLFHRSF